MDLRDQMRKKFHENGRAIKEIRAKTDPLREKYNQLSNASAAKLKELSKEFLEIEEPLAELEAERAMIVRALDGKTGEADY